MATKLVIVESPHKSETIGQFLGSGYKVVASKGHIRDLASSGKMGLGVDVDHDFTPTYKISPDKTALVRQLKAEANKASVVYLATDPDREGEAISWHLAQVLGLDVNTTPRLEFHEITKGAIEKALANPRTIDMDLVESQETRRIIDRLMGFRLSTLLQKKIKSRSAGRVQSVVLKFIVDREKEIKAFVPVEFWTIADTFGDNEGHKLDADLASYKGKPITIPNEKEADRIISELPKEFFVKSLKTVQVRKEPKPPFITSTLQQEAFSHLRFSTSKTAAVAQALYEGKEIHGKLMGLITYMRTDSIRLADEFVYAAKGYINANFGSSYVGSARHQKADKNVQDAHEAIRPTDINLTPEAVKDSLSFDEYKLYKLIYERAVASLMSAKVDSVTTLTLEGNDYDFTTSATKNIFPGFTALYDKDEEKQNVNKLPEGLKEGDKFLSLDPKKTQHFTKAPARYNEGTIVKLMKDDGIGRPSTYATTISTLIKRDYVKSEKGALIPTEQGILTVEKLSEYFPKYMDAGYTAGMETNLDSIADGKTNRVALLTDFWDEFQKYYSAADRDMAKIQPKVVEGRVCPKCGKPLVYRTGKYGEFIGCSDYPNCDYIEKEKPKTVEGRVCPKCGSPLVYRKGKRGEFIGCSNYPHCTYMEDLKGNPIEKTKKELVIPPDAPLCPKCHTGHLIERTSRYGTKFIGCSNYPRCRYVQKEPGEKSGKTTRKSTSKSSSSK